MIRDTRNKRTPLQRKQDRVKIAEMYIQGKYQTEIAKYFGLSQTQISNELKKIQKEWIKKTTIALDEHKTKELVKIDHLERTYWQAWGKEEKDPRFLDGIHKCIEQRCKLLGIYQQTDVSGLIINLVSSKDVNIENC